MKIFIFLAAIVVFGMFFFRPIKERFADLYPDRASKEEKQFVGTVSEKNPRVEEIQKMLKELGFYKRVVDSKMGKETRSALTAFQKQNNIDATGKADLKTLNELRKQTMARSADRKPSVKKKDGAVDLEVSYDIKTIQSLLKEAEFYKGQIDGRMGPETVKAIKQFQMSRSLKASGVINVKTWKELKKLEPRR